MAEPNNKEEYILNSDWEELIDQTDITPLVTMTDENTPEYTVTINQPEGATITVALLSGETKTETFTAKQGTVYTVSISGDNASKLILNTNGGKVLGDMTIEARDYSKDDNPNYCSIIILQEHAEDQVIYCHLTNPDGTEDTTEYRNSLWVQPGSRCDFTLETNFVRKWDLGKLNVETINPVTKNVNYVYATPPVIRDDFDPTICVVTIIQVPHMTIHVWVTAPGETTEVEHTETFNAKIGSTYRITTTMESNWYEGGRVLYPTTGTFSLDCTITGVSPELVMFTVHIIQTAHQTITVNCNGANYTTDFQAKPESTFTTTIQADVGYCEGDANYPTGTVLGEMWITASAVVAYREKFDLLIGEGWTEGGKGPFVGFSAWNFDDFHYGDISPRTWIDEVNYDRYATPAGGGMSVKGAWSPTMVLKGWHFYFPDGTYIRCAANSVRPGRGDNDGFPTPLNATAIRDKMVEYMGKWITFYLFY